MRIGQLDSLRGIFALLVVAYHAPIAHSFMNAQIVRNGSVGVNFFFVLSGFVIMLAYGGRIRSWRGAVDFTVARIGRLWPLHLFVMFAMLLYMLARWTMDQAGVYAMNDAVIPDMLVWRFLQQALMLHAFANDTGGEINAVSWSIAVEFWCYLLFAAIALVRRRLFAILISAALFFLAFCVLIGLLEVPFGNARQGLWRAIYYFTLGAISYVAFDRLHRRGVSVGTTVELGVILIYGIVIYYWRDLPLQNLWGALTFAPGMVLLALGTGGVTRILNTRFFRMLGDRSYSIYMLHMLVLLGLGISTRLAERVTGFTLTEIRPWPGGEIEALSYGSTLAANAAFIGLVAVIVILSGWTYRHIELPGQRAARRWKENRRRVDAMAGIGARADHAPVTSELSGRRVEPQHQSVRD